MSNRIKTKIPVFITIILWLVTCSHGVLFSQAVSISLPIYKNITVLHENVSITISITNASSDTIYIPGLYPERYGSLYNLDSAKYFKATATSYHHQDAHITILPGDAFNRLIYVVYEYGYATILPFPFLPAGDYLFNSEIPYYTRLTDFLSRTNSCLLSANATFRVARMTDEERVFIDRCKYLYHVGKKNRYDSLSVMIQRAPSSRIREALYEHITIIAFYAENNTADSLVVEYISTYPNSPISHHYVKDRCVGMEKIFILTKLLDRDIPVELRDEVVKSRDRIMKSIDAIRK